ncbi:NAD-P-binding protein, partial [Fomes fomentarius]
RVAIITGAAQGIGEATALRLADDGIDVALFDLPQKQGQLGVVAQSIRKKGRRAFVTVGDVTVDGDVADLVQTTAKELGGLDIMVANAGLFWLKPFLDSTVEEWEKMMSVNVRGVMLCFKHAASQMVQQGRGGRIVGTSHNLMQRFTTATGFLQASAYCSSKFAVRGLTQAVALELQQYGITVNSYAPGLINTPLTFREDDGLNGGPCTTLLKQVGLPTNLPVGDAQTVAEFVSFIVKPEAYHITGQCTNINGGVVMD